MKIISTILLFFILQSPLTWSDSSNAPPAKTIQYFSGQSRITNLITGQTGTQDLILIRVIDPLSSMITEIACFKDGNKPAAVSSVYMRVDGQNLTLADTSDVDHPDQLRGTGSVWGKPWNWSYLKFSFIHSSGVRIEDGNWIVGNKIIARKQLFLPNGMPLQLWEAEIPQVDEIIFKTLQQQMECPDF